jgi:hypothetical protein
MDFDYLLESVDDDARQKERTALVIFYLEKEKGKSEVTQSEVKEEIQSSRSVIQPSSVSQYFRRLQEDNWLTNSENGGYRLTIPGQEGVKALLPTDILDGPRDESEKFINSTIFEEHRYQKLVDDINKSYRYQIYDGTMVLTRKFFENMVFEILRDEYSGKDVQMFFDQANQRHYSFDELLNNFKNGVPNLKRFTKQGLDREMVEDIRNLKDMGNKSAHSIRVDYDDGEIEAVSEDATQFAEVLYEILKGVENANGSSE